MDWTYAFKSALLPAGVKRAFASVCPDAGPGWRTAADAAESAGEDAIVPGHGAQAAIA